MGTPLGPGYRLMFVVFIFFMVFAVVNEVTGIFVDSAMQSSLSDREVVINEMLAQKENDILNMQRLFSEIDEDNSGVISFEEFEKRLDDERAIAYFEAMKLDVTDVTMLCTLLDVDNSGCIDIEEFIVGCQRLKGESRSLDIAT